MKKLIVIASVAFSSAAFAQTDIADARTYSVGQTVTVSGVATNGGELGNIRYMQDESAGIAAYGTSVSGVNRYDSITVTGEISEFSGLLEIAPISDVVNHGPATQTILPIELPIPDVGEDDESEYFVVHDVAFQETGSFAGNTTYHVTDGTNVLDVRVNDGTDIVGTAIPTGQVSLYGLVGEYNGTYQSVPRDLNDIVPYTPPTKEINVLSGGATILTGTDMFIGNTATTNFDLENLGETEDLNISDVTLTGADAADFSTDLATGAYAPSTSTGFVVNYTPSGTGSHFATLEITSDDADEPLYVINFEGVGTDDLATEPTANPSALTFDENLPYKVSASFTAGTGAEKYIVLWKNGAAVTEMPVDATTYLRGDVIGGARVAYVGSATGFTPRHTIANQNYHFAVYAFNGQGGFENYLTSTAGATGDVTTPGEQIGTYYNGVNTENATFVSDLSAAVYPHNFISYFNYKQTVMNEFEVRDTTNGDSYVVCSYSGERKVFSGSFDWTATNYSREHVFPHSWMPSHPADSPEQEEYTDQHNLLPTNFPEVNQVRSNYPLGIVVNETSSYLGSKFGEDANGNLVFEPMDAMKGNAARAMMYEAVAYNGQDGQNWGFPNPISEFVPYIPYGQDIALIKEWHFNDLPDNYEIARNEYVYSVQGNRNPFVDSTVFACFVDFTDISYIEDGCASSINEKVQDNLHIYPVPANDMVYIQVDGTPITAYEVYDINGKTIEENTSTTKKIVELDVNRLQSGTYFIHVDTEFGEAIEKIIVE